MQDKLFITYRYSNDVKTIDLSKVENESILFDFNEYDKVDVRLNSDAYIVEMDCSAFRVKNQVTCCDASFILQPNVEYSISDGSVSQKVGYAPSVYKLNIYSKNGKVWNCYFKVRSNMEVEDKGIENVIEKLEEFIPGITIDFFREGPVLEVSKIKDYKLFWVNELLLKNCDMIVMHCNNILYRYTPIDEDANRMLKMYVQKLLYLVQSISVELDSYAEKKMQQLNQQTKDLGQYKEQLEMTTSRLSKTALKSKKIDLVQNIKETQKWCDKLADWQNSHAMVIQKLNELIYSTRLKSVTASYTQEYCPTFFTNVHYRFFSDMYNQIQSMNYDCARDFQMCTNKKTYQLFELYGGCFIHHLLLSLGLHITNESMLNVFMYESDVVLHYQGDQGFVDVAYDHFCPRKHEADMDEIVSVNSIHCKPDYIVSVYDANHQFKDMFIIDMKYRRLKNMVSEDDVMNETDDILTDYSQLEYKRFRQRPSMVAIMYPTMEETVFDRFDGTFVGINLTLNYEDSQAYAFIKKVFEQIWYRN